jgi:hypothetical protein
VANYVQNDEPEKWFQELTEDMYPDKKCKLETCVLHEHVVVCRSREGQGPVYLAMTAMAMPPAERLDVDHSDDNQHASLAPAPAPTSTSTTNDLPERHGLKQHGLS